MICGVNFAPQIQSVQILTYNDDILRTKKSTAKRKELYESKEGIRIDQFGDSSYRGILA